MWRASWGPLLTGAAAGGGFASFVAGLAGYQLTAAPLTVAAGAAGGLVLATAATRVLQRDPLVPLDGPCRTMPEVERVLAQGYEISFRRAPPGKKVQAWTFEARHQGRVVGRLDVDFMAASRWLYVGNIHVGQAHGKRGLGTALLLSAARTTDCWVLTTSGRTGQGLKFFARNEEVLRSYGVEMRQKPP